jgi:hypothetical protein
MKIKLEIVPRKFIHGFTMFAKIDKELLRQTKMVEVETDLITKTRVSTKLQIGEANNRINFPIEGFKTFEKTEYNWASGFEETSYYFVLSKKQGLEQYKKYVIEVVKEAITTIGVELDELTIRLEEPKFS